MINTSVFRAVSFLLFVFIFAPSALYSQIKVSSGNPTGAASQLIYWYDRDELTDFDERRLSLVQVTNTNPEEGVWIHVQIFMSYDADDNLATTDDKILCDERNFIDFLTPNDTHAYILNEDTFPKNIGESGGEPGQSTSISISNSKGFVVITPVVSQSDLTAISFRHLAGTMVVTDFDTRSYRLNAMGRDAVDFITGDYLADGTPLDGVTAGFALLQPSELIFNFAITPGTADIVAMAFSDVYGDPGFLGYGIRAANVRLTSFIFDFKESATSCGNRDLNCFMDIGLTDNIGPANLLLGDDVLCSSVTAFPAQETNNILVGWGRVFVTQYDDFDNVLGLVAFQEDEYGVARWMNTY